MKCPYCNQEMINKKDYCVNCGNKLTNEKKYNIKGIIILFTSLIIVGFITCYTIINYNTKEEIKPYINKNN